MKISSTSSYFTLASIAMTASPDCNASKRKVAFAADHDTVLVEQIEELDTEAIWFTPQDYFEIKAQTRRDSKDWRRRGYGILLNETFENPLEEAQEYLNAFCQLEDDLARRGLEKYLSRRHGEERSDLKDRARHCVLSHQRRLKQDGEEKIDDQLLGKIYEDMCHCAKVFARRIAKADALVVLEGCTNEPADKILDDENAIVEGGRQMERRMSNYSVASINSADSVGRKQPPLAYARTRTVAAPSPPQFQKARCPSSPSSPPEEYYAAVA